MTKTYSIIQLRIWYTIYLLKRLGPQSSKALAKLHGVSQRHINKIINEMYSLDLIYFQKEYKLTKKVKKVQFIHDIL
jgi:Mn-dependent DtxR family transcriptional regulator